MGHPVGNADKTMTGKWKVPGRKKRRPLPGPLTQPVKDTLTALRVACAPWLGDCWPCSAWWSRMRNNQAGTLACLQPREFKSSPYPEGRCRTARAGPFYAGLFLFRPVTLAATRPKRQSPTHACRALFTIPPRWGGCGSVGPFASESSATPRCSFRYAVLSKALFKKHRGTALVEQDAMG